VINTAKFGCESFAVCLRSRYVFPDFLPNPDMMQRDKLAEKLERRDMVRRRAVVEIPEFYVGKNILCSFWVF